MIVAFEGIDGSGKSTQLAMLKKCLEECGKDVVVYKFPTHQTTRLGQYVDECLHGKIGDVGDEAHAMLMSADRYQMKDRIADETKRKWLLMDRYYFSNIAYQGGAAKGAGKKAMVAWLWGLESRLPQADMTFVFDIPPEKSLELMKKRGKKLDNYEASLAMQKATRETYLEQSKIKKFIVIPVLDAKGNIREPEEIHNEVWSYIEPLL